MPPCVEKLFCLLYNLPYVPSPVSLDGMILTQVKHSSFGFSLYQESERLADLLFRQLEKECGKVLKRAGGSQNKT